MDECFAGSISGIFQTIFGHPLDTLKVWKQDNIKKQITIRNLYRGVSYPLITSSFLVSFNYTITMKAYQENNSYILSGIYGGVITGLITAPIEYMKVNNQANVIPANVINQFKFKNNIGFIPTIMREGVGFPVYYQSYYYCKEKYQMTTLSAGGLSGLLSWTFCYPFDTIKTRIQSGQSISHLEAIKYGNLWAGYRYCAMRAILTNSIGWSVYEFAKGMF